jgi:hypothetical protein
MKNFKDFLSELFEPEVISSEGITPELEKDYGSFIKKTYKTKIGDNEVATFIAHTKDTGKSDIKFFVNHSTKEKPRNLTTLDAFKIYNAVLSHINHHIQNSDRPIKVITYSHSDDELGHKKSQLYKAIGKRFNIPLESRVV